MVQHVLVSGASVAGPALASLLAAAGVDVTVVERADGLREEGQNVDVRGVGREVLRRMGLEDAVRAAGTGESGTDFVDGRGRPFASFDAGTDDSGGATAELEILRGRLARILHDHSLPRARYVFGDRITALHDDGAGVDVEFEFGPRRRFDLVVVAEGLRSRTRELVVPGGAVHELGLYCAYAAIPRTPGDDDRWRWHPCGRGRTASLRPDDAGTTRVFLSFVSDVRGLDRLGRDDVVAVLRATYADAGWEVPRILRDLDDAELYFEAIGQARLPAWSTGRVALLGDAAYASSPISGMGTTLALAGAYVLAGELASDDDPLAALARYEQVLRPLVTRAQKLPPGTPRLAHPRTAAGVAAFRAATRLATSPAFGALSGLVRPPADAITLPDYRVPGGPLAA
jgi:2-polyprenyl-6-methoxyphenol hydroxylase-like FAD-dependent oxidoreductase